MIRANNYITFLLVLIVIILVFGVGLAIYYVLDLNWFGKKVDIYAENIIPNEQIETKQRVEGYDLAKRNYDIVINGDDFKITVYKDGTVGIKMIDNEENRKVSIYKEIRDKEIKTSLTNIVRAYEVYASKTSTAKKYIVLVDKDGNLYKLVNEELIKDGRYAFGKIEGIAGIMDIKEISNENTSPLLEGINVIAIDSEGNEILLTDYLVNN